MVKKEMDDYKQKGTVWLREYKNEIAITVLIIVILILSPTPTLCCGPARIRSSTVWGINNLLPPCQLHGNSWQPCSAATPGTAEWTPAQRVG